MHCNNHLIQNLDYTKEKLYQADHTHQDTLYSIQNLRSEQGFGHFHKRMKKEQYKKQLYSNDKLFIVYSL